MSSPIRFRSPPAARSSDANSGTVRRRHAITDPVIVVGAGVAGCAAAATALGLGRSVRLIEAGGGGPLPPALRSPDLNHAGQAADWWWDHRYPAGRGVGGGSAVNGMVLQKPAIMDGELLWAWDCFDPVEAEPGPLAVELGAEPLWLSLRNGERRTAADVWLGPHARLTVADSTAATPAQVEDWLADGNTVLIAAGALRSPELVGVQGWPARDHRSVVVGFEVPFHLRAAPGGPAATALIRHGDVQLLVLERAGRSTERGALVVSAMTPDADVHQGVQFAVDLLAGAGLAGAAEDGPAPVAHACCTLTGIETITPVVDASTLPELPAVNPMLTVAAHARRQTLKALMG